MKKCKMEKFCPPSTVVNIAFDDEMRGIIAEHSINTDTVLYYTAIFLLVEWQSWMYFNLLLSNLDKKYRCFLNAVKKKMLL